MHFESLENKNRKAPLAKRGVSSPPTPPIVKINNAKKGRKTNGFLFFQLNALLSSRSRKLKKFPSMKEAFTPNIPPPQKNIYI